MPALYFRTGLRLSNLNKLSLFSETCTVTTRFWKQSKNRALGTTSTYYQSTPLGMVTSGGGWYLAPEAAIEKYAGGVLKHVSLTKVLQFADSWALLPGAVGFFITLIALFFSPWWLAAGLGVVVYIAARLILPGVVLPSLSSGVRILVHPIFQVLAAFLVLSYLGMQDQLTLAVTGLVAFALYRWDLLGIALNPLLSPLLNRAYPLSVADQILRATLIRLALRHGVELPQIATLEAKMRKTLNRTRT